MGQYTSQKKKALPARLHVHRELRCEGKRYPLGSLLPWRDCGLSTERVLLLLKTGYLSDEPWPGLGGKKPPEPEQLDVETGEELAARLEQEAEEKQERSDMLEERKRELLAQGMNERDAQSQAAGELAALVNELPLEPTEAEQKAQRDAERAEQQRRQKAERERLEAEQAEREHQERQRLLQEQQEQEGEDEEQSEGDEESEGEGDEQGEESGEEQESEGDEEQSEGESEEQGEGEGSEQDSEQEQPEE